MKFFIQILHVFLVALAKAAALLFELQPVKQAAGEMTRGRSFT